MPALGKKFQLIPATMYLVLAYAKALGVGWERDPVQDKLIAHPPCASPKKQLQKPTTKVNVSCRSAVLRTEAELGMDFGRSRAPVAIWDGVGPAWKRLALGLCSVRALPESIPRQGTRPGRWAPGLRALDRGNRPAAQERQGTDGAGAGGGGRWVRGWPRLCDKGEGQMFVTRCSRE